MKTLKLNGFYDLENHCLTVRFDNPACKERPDSRFWGHGIPKSAISTGAFLTYNNKHLGACTIVDKHNCTVNVSDRVYKSIQLTLEKAGIFGRGYMPIFEEV